MATMQEGGLLTADVDSTTRVQVPEKKGTKTRLNHVPLRTDVFSVPCPFGPGVRWLDTAREGRGWTRVEERSWA